MKDGKYWKIISDEPYLSISLEKLGVPEIKIAIWKNFIGVRKKVVNMNFVYVGYDDEGFGWSSYTKISQDWYKEHNYKYKGEIKVSDFEVDANKYNL